MIGIRTVQLRRLLPVAMAIALTIAAIHLHTSARAGSWPESTVRMLVPGVPGSSVDLAARLFAERFAQRWGKPAIVENRPGADGILAVQALLHANDGHTLLFAFPGIVTVVPLLHDNIPYDPVGDLVPIASAAYDFLSVAVSARLPVSTLDDLVTFAMSRPGSLNWAAAPGAPYLAFLEFQQRAGITMTYVSYRGAAPAMPDLMADQIQLTVTPLASALPLAREGRIKLLAVTTRERSAAAPDLMTAVEAGHPELTLEAPLGLFGPNTIPTSLRDRIAADVDAVTTNPAVRQRLNVLGMVAHASTPAEYVAMLAEQRTRWTALARIHGAHPQP
jgi:tripartite-type tricarboxylate transporter receptor subunit TctC